MWNDDGSLQRPAASYDIWQCHTDCMTLPDVIWCCNISIWRCRMSKWRCKATFWRQPGYLDAWLSARMIRVTPKNRPFSSWNFFGFDFKNFFQSISFANTWTFFPPEIFLFKVYISTKSHVIWSYFDVFALFRSPKDFWAPSMQSGMKFLDPKPLQKAS